LAEFRDLAMECEFHGKDTTTLRNWDLPRGARHHTLVKGAPKPMGKKPLLVKLTGGVLGTKPGLAT